MLEKEQVFPTVLWQYEVKTKQGLRRLRRECGSIEASRLRRDFGVSAQSNAQSSRELSRTLAEVSVERLRRFLCCLIGEICAIPVLLAVVQAYDYERVRK
jgi:hypothetical protein